MLYLTTEPTLHNTGSVHQTNHQSSRRSKRLKTGILLLIALLVGAFIDHRHVQHSNLEKPPVIDNTESRSEDRPIPNTSPLATLQLLDIKGRAPRTGYLRSHFSNGWIMAGGCDTRNRILRRDLTNVTLQPDNCLVRSGVLDDPYTGEKIQFVRGAGTSQMVQIDHVVALSDAWQKGAQLLTRNLREQLSNDPLNLLAVQGQANQNKGDSDAATWLPPKKTYRCPYVARQVAVKYKYSLWVTLAEHDAIARILKSCPNQKLPT